MNAFAEPVPPFARYRRSNWQTFLRYSDQAVMYKTIFDDLKIAKYEEIVENGSLISGFMALLDLDASDFEGNQHVRPGMSAIQVEVKKYAAKKLKTKEHNADFLAWLREGEVTAEIEGYFERGDYGFWESGAAWHEFCSAAMLELQRLRETGLTDNEPLYVFPNATNEIPPPVPKLPGALKRMVDDAIVKCAERKRTSEDDPSWGSGDEEA
ncbi:hypothetical protein FJU11_11290 [Pararhizobium mangrovi]|uniref:Uncharacterized protein n=2 Tax=Pararhizobium mangrovi TaxID=2590452 RepID=A0A506U2G3_9HYPH|nr:hypothetical protein FJU11_11290 [Pararhizobium mangrovi]